MISVPACINESSTGGNRMVKETDGQIGPQHA